MEWSNIYNPFNSIKALVWADRFEMLTKGEIPQPVSVTIDPTNLCQLNCPWCHCASWRNKSPSTFSTEDLLKLAKLVVNWHKQGGPVAVCVAGGGEPLLHKAYPNLIRMLVDGGLQVGMITNGVNLQGKNLETSFLCRWVGFSVDAGTATSYAVQKGTASQTFFKVLSNMKALSQHSPRPSIGFKFLLQPSTLGEIKEAVAIAKNVGADDFHARPLYLPELVWGDDEINMAKAEVEIARSLFEDSHFHVYGVTHKFAPNFQRALPNRCEVTPLAGLTFCADGWCYLCCDRRGDEDARMCQWDDIMQFWGSEEHKQLLSSLDTGKCTRRCTFGAYQEILDKVFRADAMCRAFI